MVILWISSKSKLNIHREPFVMFRMAIKRSMWVACLTYFLNCWRCCLFQLGCFWLLFCQCECVCSWMRPNRLFADNRAFRCEHREQAHERIFVEKADICFRFDDGERHRERDGINGNCNWMPVFYCFMHFFSFFFFLSSMVCCCSLFVVLPFVISTDALFFRSFILFGCLFRVIIT